MTLQVQIKDRDEFIEIVLTAEAEPLTEYIKALVGEDRTAAIEIASRNMPPFGFLARQEAKTSKDFHVDVGDIGGLIDTQEEADRLNAITPEEWIRGEFEWDGLSVKRTEIVADNEATRGIIAALRNPDLNTGSTDKNWYIATLIECLMNYLWD